MTVLPLSCKVWRLASANVLCLPCCNEFERQLHRLCQHRYLLYVSHGNWRVKWKGAFLNSFATLQVFLWGKNLEIYWMEKAPQAQFVGRQKLNYFLVRFPSQWQKIVKGMVTVTMETPTFFFARGKGTSTGYLYLARLQTLFSIITSAWFTCVGRPVSLREHSHPSTCV